MEPSEQGGLRHQFHHVNDLAPTIYDVIGVTPPTTYHGYEQMPITGTSLRYTFSEPDAPSQKKVQYFEMVGHRAIYCDGWKAVTRHEPGTSFDDDRWELYHVDVDRSECHDLAAEEPERLKELIALWWEEAEEHHVLPLDDRGLELFGARFKDRSAHPLSRKYTYLPPISPMPAQAGAPIGGRSWDLDAWATLDEGQGGVIYASGTENSGLSIFVQHGRLIFDYNVFNEHLVLESSTLVPTGDVHLRVIFRRTGRGGTVALEINGAPAGEMALPFVMRTLSSVGPSVGFDAGSAVSDRYVAPFTFEGRLERVEIQLVTPRRDQEHDVRESEARAIMGRQ
jgi:arylsulfatase